MAETGLDWEPRFFEFTDKDCDILAKSNKSQFLEAPYAKLIACLIHDAFISALTLCPTIEWFELQRSSVTDEQMKILVRDGLLLMPHLQTLNLSYNNIQDAGAKAIARLITDEDSRVRHTLRTLILARCHIRNKGAKALAYALTINSHLTSLDIRLNSIRDSGTIYDLRS
jgi:Ran GTPase-activating protein (RanGAP) involved in mRNA processing and transport